MERWKFQSLYETRHASLFSNDVIVFGLQASMKIAREPFVWDAGNPPTAQVPVVSQYRAKDSPSWNKLPHGIFNWQHFSLKLQSEYAKVRIVFSLGKLILAEVNSDGS